MDQSGSGNRWAGRWLVLLAVAFVLRVGAAVAVQVYADRKGTPCVFGDTTIYLALAKSLAEGQPYQVDQWGVPHLALRTPGYPGFLAVCRRLFGPSLLPARIVQAALGTLTVALVAGLTGRFTGRSTGPQDRHSSPAWWAALVAALDPYLIILSALALSEAVFLPLMMGALWAIAAIWPAPADREGWGETGLPRRPWALAGLAGALMGLAVLTRPSWAACVVFLLLGRVGLAARGGRRLAWRTSAIMGLVVGLVMLPWWARNARELGRFVPTALWVGASLYDGISPTADGSSEMSFLDAEEVRVLSEVEQDRVLGDRALAFARTNPARVVQLAWIKAGRFWSPWPNASGLNTPWIAALSMLATLPIYGLVARGAWIRRRDPRTWVLLLGPLIVFFGLHLIFVSSVRYRAPGMAPAAALAGLALGARPGRDGPQSNT